MSKLLVLCVFLGVPALSLAQTSTISISPEAAPVEQTTTIKTSEVIKGSDPLNKKFADDAEITDAKLKADSGSLSRYSLKFNLSFNGPPVGDLSSDMQPNPDGGVAVNETSLSGSISARYRIDSKSTISLGTGVSALTPLQGAKRYDVKNPFISYDMNSHPYDIQMRNSIGVSAVTTPAYRDIGEYAGLNYDNSLVYNIGTSGFAAGFDTSFSYYLYERGVDTKSRKEMRTGRYNLSFYPQVKYNFSDKFSVNTSLAMKFINPRGTNDESVLWNQVLSQRVGMGYAFTRDIYFAPYINFYPKNAEMDTTTFNLSTTFSIL